MRGCGLRPPMCAVACNEPTRHRASTPKSCSALIHAGLDNLWPLVLSARSSRNQVVRAEDRSCVHRGERRRGQRAAPAWASVPRCGEGDGFRRTGWPDSRPPRTGRPRFPDAANCERWSALGADSWGAGFEAGSASARRRRRRCPSLNAGRPLECSTRAMAWGSAPRRGHPWSLFIAVIVTALRHCQRHRRNSAPRAGYARAARSAKSTCGGSTHDDVSRGARNFGPYSRCHKGRYTVRTQSAGTSATLVRLQ